MSDIAVRLAAALLLVLGVAHSYLGERHLIVRLLRRPDLPKLRGSEAFTRHTIRFAWHLTSVAWWGMAAMVLMVHADSPAAALRVASLTALLSAAITGGFSRGRHLAWVVFGATGVLLWWASAGVG